MNARLHVRRPIDLDCTKYLGSRPYFGRTMDLTTEGMRVGSLGEPEDTDVGSIYRKVCWIPQVAVHAGRGHPRLCLDRGEVEEELGEPQCGHPGQVAVTEDAAIP